MGIERQSDRATERSYGCALALEQRSVKYLTMTMTMTMTDWRPMSTMPTMPTMPTRTGGLAIGDVVSDQGWKRSPPIRKANGSWACAKLEWAWCMHHYLPTSLFYNALIDVIPKLLFFPHFHLSGTLPYLNCYSSASALPEVYLMIVQHDHCTVAVPNQHPISPSALPNPVVDLTLKRTVPRSSKNSPLSYLPPITKRQDIPTHHDMYVL